MLLLRFRSHFRPHLFLISVVWQICPGIIIADRSYSSSGNWNQPICEIWRRILLRYMSNTGTLTASKGNSGVVNHRRHSDSVLTTYENDSSARSTCYEWRSQRMRSVPFVRRVVDRALDASRRKRDGMIGRDGNRGRTREERIERERMRGRGERKSSRGETREEERDYQWRVSSIRQTLERDAGAKLQLGLGVEAISRDASRVDDCRRRGVCTSLTRILGVFVSFAMLLAVMLRPRTRHEEAASSDDSGWPTTSSGEQRRVRPRDADAMRRRSAPGCVQGRATSTLCGFSPPHTRMHVLFGCTGGYIKSGWIYRGEREGRLLITRRVDQPLSFCLSSSFLSLPVSLC